MLAMKKTSNAIAMTTLDGKNAVFTTPVEFAKRCA
jgi:hypothetical protein